MIKHYYPSSQRGNGVGLYGKFIQEVIDGLSYDGDIHHFELGYNEHELLWQAYKLLRSKPQGKVVVTLHDPPIVVGKPFSHYLASPNIVVKAVRKSLDVTLGRYVIAYVVRRADALIVLNAAALPVVAKEYSVQTKKIHTSHLPSLTPLTTSKAPLRNDVRLLYFGNISPRKGLDVLISALQDVAAPTITLDVVGGSKGNESYVKTLQQLITQLPGTTTVTIHGYLKDAELSQLINQCDIIILPYRSEGIIHASGPLATAMKAGKAIVCSRLPIFNDVVDGQTGVLFDSEDVEQLSEQLQRLVVTKETREQLGKAAATWYAQNCSSQTIYQDIKKVYEAL